MCAKCSVFHRLWYVLLPLRCEEINNDGYQILCFVDRSSLYNLFQMKSTRCTLLLSIFISTSLHVSGNYVPIIRRTYCVYATLVFFTLCGWLSGLLQRSRQPLIEINTGLFEMIVGVLTTCHTQYT